MDMLKRTTLFLIVYVISVFLLYIASEFTPYLLPVIWLAAFILLICGLGYVFYHQLFQMKRKRSR